MGNLLRELHRQEMKELAEDILWMREKEKQWNSVGLVTVPDLIRRDQILERLEKMKRGSS